MKALDGWPEAKIKEALLGRQLWERMDHLVKLRCIEELLGNEEILICKTKAWGTAFHKLIDVLETLELQAPLMMSAYFEWEEYLKEVWSRMIITK